MTLTTEAGTIGGVPASPPDFGHSYNPEAVIEHHAQFDFYDGGGIDIAFLGMAQADKDGNVNVTKFGNRVVGGGLSYQSKQPQSCLLWNFTAGLKVEVKDGKLIIIGRQGNLLNG